MVVIYCEQCGTVIASYIGKSLDEITELHKHRTRHSASCAGSLKVIELGKGKGKG